MSFREKMGSDYILRDYEPPKVNVSNSFDCAALFKTYHVRPHTRLSLPQLKLIALYFEFLLKVLKDYLTGGFCGFDKEGSPIRVELFGYLDMKVREIFLLYQIEIYPPSPISIFQAASLRHNQTPCRSIPGHILYSRNDTSIFLGYHVLL